MQVRIREKDSREGLQDVEEESCSQVAFARWRHLGDREHALFMFHCAQYELER